MTAPQPTAFIQGQGTVSADNLNTFVQTVSNIAQLRTLIGLPGMQILLEGSSTPGDGGAGTYYWNTTATGPDNGTTIIIPQPNVSGAWIKLTSTLPYQPINIKTYGAIGNGFTDDTAAIQTAFNDAISTGQSVYIPATIPGYLITKPLNLTNLAVSLLIFGDGMIAPFGNQADSAPTQGSIFLGGTGSGKCIIDCSGSNNIIFRDLNFVALGVTNPSTIGTIFAHSTTGPSIATGGGANGSLINIAYYMTNVGNYDGASIASAWIGGAGSCLIENVVALAVTPIYVSAFNVLGVTSTYVTFSLGNGGCDAFASKGCSLLSYGQACLYLESCVDHTWSTLYCVTIVNGPSFPNVNVYGIYIKDCNSITITLQVDYFPGAFYISGTAENINITGTTFSGPTSIPAAVAIFGNFTSTTTKNCNFNLSTASGNPANYYYICEPPAISLTSCTFSFDTGPSNLILYFNVASGGPTVPFFNLVFNGNADGGTFSFLINGSPATAANERYFVNGIRFGTG